MRLWHPSTACSGMAKIAQRLLLISLIALSMSACGVQTYGDLRLQMSERPAKPDALLLGAKEQPEGSSSIAGTALALMPWPSQIEVIAGRFEANENLTVAVIGKDQTRVRAAVSRWLEQIQQQQNAELSYVWLDDHAELADMTIDVKQVSTQYPELESKERYTLAVNAEGIALSADSFYGVLRGLQTLRQSIIGDRGRFQFPYLRVDDAPQWAWRGIVLDTARHFIPLVDVKRLITAMEMVKLNVLHLHLSDDQGFRVESKVLPELHVKASEGQYYQQHELAELIQFAAARGVRIVPEFGLPGHSLSWQVAYPYLSVDESKELALGQWDAVFSPPIDPTKDTSFSLIEKLVAEMSALFPDRYFHIGSDEVNEKVWQRDSDVRQFMQDQGLNSTSELHTYFARRYADIVRAHDKYPIAWEEALGEVDDSGSHEYSAQPMVIQLWLKGEYSEALASHPIIMSRDYYLDHKQPSWWLYQQGVMDFDIEGKSRESLSHQLMGGELAVWSEYVDAKTLDTEVWPRSAVIAERFWTPSTVLDLSDFGSLYRRIDEVSRRMGSLGIRHESEPLKHMERLAAEGDVLALKTFAQLIEPSGYYYQRSTRRMLRYAFSAIFPFVSTPPYSGGELHRLVEYLPAESVEARHFWELVDRYLAGDTTLYTSIQQRLEAWSNNHELLQSTIEGSSALENDDIHLLSKAVSEVATVGLEALNALHSGDRLGVLRGWWLAECIDDYNYGVFSFENFEEIVSRAFQRDVFQQHNIAIQPAVQRLLNAARSRN